MIKAMLNLPNGTKVQIEGPPEEVEQLLVLYSATQSKSTKHTAPRTDSDKGKKPAPVSKKSDAEELDLTPIVNLVKSCEEAEDIEQQVLDRTSQVDRTLLPLYVVYKHLDNKYALSSGDVNKVTTQLSVPVSTPNASRTLSGTASKYVMADTVRKKGVTVRYKLNRRGVKYMEAVISGDSSAQ